MRVCLQLVAMYPRLKLQGAQTVEIVCQGTPNGAGVMEQGIHMVSALSLLATGCTADLQLTLTRCYVTAELAAQLNGVASEWKGIALEYPLWTTDEPQGQQLPPLVSIKCEVLNDHQVVQVRTRMHVCMCGITDEPVGVHRCACSDGLDGHAGGHTMYAYHTLRHACMLKQAASLLRAAGMQAVRVPVTCVFALCVFMVSGAALVRVNRQARGAVAHQH